jgi:PAS domain S-box-containing protein
MGEKDLRDLLEGLFSDLPTEPDAASDLTPGVRTADTLGFVEDTLLQVVDHLVDAVLVTDREGTIRFANAAAERAFRCAGTELLGQAINVLQVGSHDGDLSQEIQRTCLSGNTWHGEAALRRLDGTSYTTGLTVSPMRDRFDEVSQLIWIQRDVPEISALSPRDANRDDLSAALSRRDAQFQAVAEVSRAVSSILDLDELLVRVVDLICHHFNLYYAGIFLIDETGAWTGDPGKWAMLRSGTGEAGEQMVASGHRLEIGGTSMIGWCIANRKARISDRAGEEAIRFANPLLPETRSEMALPLISRGRVIGAMTIQDSREKAFSEHDISVLQAMADQLGNAIQNALLFQETARQLTELAVVNEISRAISSAIQLDELTETVHRQVSRLFDTTNFYIATYTEGDHQWCSYFHLENGVRQPSAWYGIEAGLTGQIIRTRQPILFRTAHEIVAFHEAHQRTVIGDVARSWLGVPLIASDKVVGVMAIQDYANEFLYGEQDLALFSTVAAQVAVALDGLRLLEQTRRRAQELEVVNRVGSAITSVLDLDTVLRQIADTIKAHFGHYFVGISLLQENRLIFHGGSKIGDSADRLGMVGFDLTGGRSLIAEVARTGQPALVNDVLADPRYLPVDSLPDTRSELDLPIKVKGKVIGVLDVQSDQPNAFASSDLPLLQSLADQAGVAIENARLFEEAQQRLKELTRLSTVSQAVAEALLQPEEVATIAARHFFEALGLPECTVALLDRDQQTVKAIADLYLEDGEEKERTDDPSLVYRLEDYPATARVVETLRPLVVQASDPAADSAELAYMDEYGVATLVVLPLAVTGQATGVVELEAKDETHLTEQQMRLAMTLANQFAVALENARLFEQTQKALGEAASLYNASSRLAQARGLQEILAAVVEGGPVTAVNQAVLWTIERNAEGQPTGVSALANWPSRAAAPPFPLETRFPRTHFLASGLVLTSTPMFFSDVTQDGRVDPATGASLAQRNIRSMALLPLWVGERQLGTLMLTSEQEHQFTEREIRPYRSLAGQMAVAVDNQRLLKNTQIALAQTTELTAAREQLLAETTALYQASRQITAAQDVDQTLQAILGHVQTLDLDRCLILMLDDSGAAPSNRRATVRAVWDRQRQEADFLGSRLSAEQIPLLAILGPADRLVVDNLSAAEEVDDTTRSALAGVATGGLAIIPLAVGDRLLGWVVAATVERLDRLDERRIDALGSIAGQGAVAIEKDRLIRETHARAGRERALRQIAETISAAEDLADSLPAVAQSLATLVPLERLTLASHQPGYPECIIASADLHDSASPEELAQRRTALPLQGSASGWVITQGEARLDGDIRLERLFLEDEGLIAKGFVSRAVLPLQAGDEIYGALSVYCSHADAYSSEHLPTLLQVAGQIALALERNRLIHETRDALAQAEATYQRYLGQEWEGFLSNAARTWGYHDSPLQTAGAEDIWTPEIEKAVVEGDVVTWHETGDSAQECRSAVALPIRLAGQTIGVMDFYHDGELREWADEEKALVQALADQIALALDNARLFEKTRRSAAEQQMLFEATTVAISTADVDEMLEGIARAIFDRLSCTNVMIMMVEGANLRRRAGFGLTDGATGTHPLGPLETPIGEGIVGWVAQAGEPIITGDGSQSPHHVATASATPSALAVPIFVDQEVAGVISLESDRHNAFDENDLRLLRTLSGTVGSILRSMQLVEELQQAYEEIREIDRIKSEFLANMSHELRTPLNSIIGFSRVILKGIDGPITPLQEQDLNSIYHSGRHLLGLINNVLDLSKIEAGKMELSPEVVQVREALDIVMSTAIGLVKGRDVTLTMDVPPDMPPVWMDPIRLRQVLLNLISNAAKFTVEGTIAIQAAYDPQAVFIQVVDTGIGISEEDMDKLFKSFSQVDSSSTRRAGGSGLGLAISAQLMELQGGRIWVESQVGVGSTFSVALPRVNATGDGPITILTGEADRADSAGPITPEPSEEEPAIPQEPTVERLILAVESDVGVIDLYRRYLSGRGIRLENATTGRQGIARATELAPQLAAITVDILMPDMVGWEIIQQLRQNPSTREIPVIICSIVLDRVRAKTLGVEQYLTKPILQDDFINALEACFT